MSTIEERAADERRLQQLDPDEREQVMVAWFRRDLGFARRRAFERHCRERLQKDAQHGQLPVAVLPMLRDAYRAKETKRRLQEVSQ